MGETYGEIRERFEGVRRTPAIQRIQSFCRAFSALERRLEEVRDASAPASPEVVEAVSSLESSAGELADFPTRVCNLMIARDKPGGTCEGRPGRLGDPLA